MTRMKREALAKYGLNGNDAQRLERALCTLADYEGPVRQALSERALDPRAVSEVCAAIRRILDGVE